MTRGHGISETQSNNSEELVAIMMDTIFPFHGSGVGTNEGLRAAFDRNTQQQEIIKRNVCTNLVVV